MTPEQGIAFAVLGAAFAMFAWGRYRYDIVALAALVAVVVAGLVPARDALLGFGHPAVITVACVLIISRALRNAGIVDLVASRLEPFTGSVWAHVAVLTGAVTVCSAFMNNVGALAVMLPVALATAARHERSPSIVLMPLAFGSILGGLMTMIGTPPNVIIATYRTGLAGEAFRMFDFTPVGLAVAVAGVAFVALLGWRLVPAQRRGRAAPDALFEMSDYFVEVRVPEDSELVGKRLRDVEVFETDDVVPVKLVDENDKLVHPAPWRTLQAGAVVILKADPKQLEDVIGSGDLELVADGDEGREEVKTEELQLVEAVVQPGSALEDRKASTVRQRSAGRLSLLAASRQGRPIRTRLGEHTLRTGDVVLLQGDSDTINDVVMELGLLPLAERALRLGQPRRLVFAVAVFAAAIVAAATGTVSVAIAFLAAIVVYVLTGILSARNLYDDIDWPVIVLLAGMIPVGQALEATGGTALIAGSISAATGTFPPWVVLALVMAFTMTLSDVINNAATAVVMAPIAVGIADGLGVASDPFLMAVAVGASCAFLTPIGHQSNTLVMGPGGYHFWDYWRMGLPLEVLIVAVAVPMILVVWPL